MSDIKIDPRIKKLKGSESRDEFKYQHKNRLPSNFYACDLDLVLVDSEKVVAYLDYKRPEDKITYAEKILYKQLIGPKYIIVSQSPKRGPFTIYCYKSENEELGQESLLLVTRCEGWPEFAKWEESIRKPAEPPVLETGKFDITKFWRD